MFDTMYNTTMTRRDDDRFPSDYELRQMAFEREAAKRGMYPPGVHAAQRKPFVEALHEVAGLPPPRRTITNTTAEVASGGDARAILAQEKHGQTELVESAMLPTRNHSDGGRAALEAAGVVFGKPVATDPMFVEATLPEGWRKVATDHDMWSHLHDDLGRVRARIFYKASWHDRSAHMTVETRYIVRPEYEKRPGECEWHENGERAVVFDRAYGDNGKLLFATEWQHPKKVDGNWRSPEPHKEAEAWLAKHFPRHKDPGAYWTDPVGPASRNEVKRQASADAKRLVWFVLHDARSSDSYAMSSFQQRVLDLAQPQLRWIAKPWQAAYLAAFVATAEHGRRQRAQAPVGETETVP